LTGAQVLHTRRGKELREFCKSAEDYTGHGAIRFYYELPLFVGVNKECTDFSTPGNFPPTIVESIKSGEFRGLGIAIELLTATTQRAYNEAVAPAWKAYNEAAATVQKAYNEARATAWKAYNEATAPVWKAYNEAAATAFWDLFAIPENRKKEWRNNDNR